MSTAFGLLGSVATRVVHIIVALKTGWERRRLMGRLGMLDDYMLRDIGITRQDILSSLAEPMFRDPTIQLAARALEARKARRASARDQQSWSVDPELHRQSPADETPITQRAA